MFTEAFHDAFDVGTEPTDLSVVNVLTTFAPLSEMMKDQLGALRAWAKGRTRPATSQISERRLRKEVGGIAAIFSDLDVPDPAPLLRIGQVHEEQFIPASLPEEFRRKLRNVVCGRDDEHQRRLLLHPGQKRPEHTSGRSAIRCA